MAPTVASHCSLLHHPVNGKLETPRDHFLPHLASYIYSCLGDGQFDFVCLAVMFSKGEKNARNNPA